MYDKTLPIIGVEDAQKILDWTKLHGGGTFTSNAFPITPGTGYALSVDDDRGIELPLEDVTLTTIQTWALNHLPYIVEYNRIPTIEKSMKFIGTWIDHGMFYLDVATVFVNISLSDVMHLALDNGQRAVHDFSTGKDIWTEEYFG